MTTKILLATIKERLESAIADGDHCAAREAFLEMLQVGKTWVLEIRQSPTFQEADRAQRFTEAMEALELSLTRNEQLVTLDAPFLIGEHVEIEQIQYGPRYVWVEGTILDFRTATYRERLHRNPRALDYLVRDRDGEERWHADERIRKKPDAEPPGFGIRSH